MLDLARISGFQWDDGNARKSLDKHGVTSIEAEQVFLNVPLLVVDDQHHSSAEMRFNALGKTHDRRHLHITFTLRSDRQLIRIISARDMNRKELKIYEQD
jgi:uncharacterized protein